MISEKSFIVECNYCDVESEIYAETHMTVEYCPICGEENNAIELDSDE